MTSTKVLIVGGGPAGMASAIALHQAGLESEIVEISTDWRPGGIGIGLQSAALRATKSLGLFDQIVAAGRPHLQIDMTGPDGTPFAEIPQVNVNDAGDPPFVGMARLTLHDVMAQEVQRLGIPVRLGTTVRRLGESSDESIEVELDDGSTDDWAWVVGADGINSAIRRIALPGAPAPEYAGQSIWRVAARSPAGLNHYTMMLNGPLRVGLVPLPGGGLYLWMLDSLVGAKRPPREQLLPMFLERLAGFRGHAPEIAAQIRDDAQVDVRALHWLLVTPPWHAGRVILVGDAVHATTPHLAFGAGLALEDAVVLGELAAEGLAFHDLARRFESRRYERSRLVVENSLQLSRWEQTPGPPHPDTGALTLATINAMADPI